MTALTNQGTIEVMNHKHATSGYRWANTILAVTETANGTIEVAYPTDGRYENPNRNTTEVYYNLEHAIYNEMGHRDLETHGVDMEQVREVYGKTYEIKEWLKAQGFKWNGKGWAR